MLALTLDPDDPLAPHRARATATGKATRDISIAHRDLGRGRRRRLRHALWSGCGRQSQRRSGAGQRRPRLSTRCARRCAADRESLPPEWALQVPSDYISVLQVAVPEALRLSGVDPADVIGIGTDFTACTMVATLADGTPLCEVPEFATSPHAFVKLWRHHAAQPQADRINDLARGSLRLHGYWMVSRPVCACVPSAGA